jgi:membrane protein YqaA with SNARE-associated domain
MIDWRLIKRLFCVALVAAVMLPFGQELFPYVSHVLSGTQFQAIEAIVSATVGFGISAVVG